MTELTLQAVELPVANPVPGWLDLVERISEARRSPLFPRELDHGAADLAAGLTTAAADFLVCHGYGGEVRVQVQNDRDAGADEHIDAAAFAGFVGADQRQPFRPAAARDVGDVPAQVRDDDRVVTDLHDDLGVAVDEAGHAGTVERPTGRGGETRERGSL